MSISKKNYLWSRGYKHAQGIKWKNYWSSIGQYWHPLALRCTYKLVHFCGKLAPIFTDISSIPYNTDFVLRFEFLRNSAWGICEGVLTVWHVTTIYKHVRVVRQGHVVISSCKPRKQLNYVSVLHITYIKHILGAIWFMQPISVVVVLFVLNLYLLMFGKIQFLSSERK